MSQTLVNKISQPNSLVKYANPVLVSTSGRISKKETEAAPQSQNTYTEDILNSILPPREYTMDKQQLWIQSVSATPATKANVLQLQEQLDQKLQERQARETGICPIREELYSQCFDELIRQITINCAERGLLLVRVRDELRMTIQVYQTLYESSIAFGMRKSLLQDQKKSEMQNRIKELEGECSDLQNHVNQLEQKIQEIESTDKEQSQLEENNHNDQVNYLKKTNQRFKEELEKLLSAPNMNVKK